MNDRLNPLAIPGSAIKKRCRDSAYRAERRSTVASTVGLIAVVAAAVVLFFSFFGVKQIEGSAMYPALHDGDLVLTYFKPSFIKNEIVFYEADGAEYCGRIVAKEGDRIDFSDDGKLFVNGTAQVSDVVFPTSPPDHWEGAAVVPEGSVYILGDHRTEAADSRVLGYIPIEHVNSKAILLIRHGRM